MVDEYKIPPVIHGYKFIKFQQSDKIMNQQEFDNGFQEKFGKIHPVILKRAWNMRLAYSGVLDIREKKVLVIDGYDDQGCRNPHYTCSPERFEMLEKVLEFDGSGEVKVEGYNYSNRDKSSIFGNDSNVGKRNELCKWADLVLFRGQEICRNEIEDCSIGLHEDFRAKLLFEDYFRVNPLGTEILFIERTNHFYTICQNDWQMARFRELKKEGKRIHAFGPGQSGLFSLG